MSAADTTFMRDLNGGTGANVDNRLVPIIKFLNRLGVTTVRSRIDAEEASVIFTGTDPVRMCDLLFNHLRSMTGHLDVYCWLEMIHK